MPLVPVSVAAREMGVHDDTLRRYIRRGYFPAYRVPSKRGVLVDVAEASDALARLPKSAVRPDYGSFGPRARIVEASR